MVIRQYNSTGQIRKRKKNVQGDNITILSLNPDMFRGDLEVLSKQKELNVLRIHVGWERLIISSFYPERADALDYYNPTKDEIIEKAQAECRDFLRVLLQYLYKRIPIDCIVIPNVRYLEDLDWCYVSRELGVRIILMFREGLMMFERGYLGTLGRQKKFGKFQGDHIIVHNNVSKKMFVESGFANPDIVSINGVLRMDDFIKKIKNKKETGKHRKRVTLFYFNYDNSNEGFSTEFGYSPPGVPYELYKDTNLALINLAKMHPDIDVVIKPKPKDYESGHFQKLIKEEGVDLAVIKNYSIEPNANVHNLILGSDVIIGLQSTAILESAIAGKVIIMPYYEKFRKSEWSDRFGYRNYLGLFKVASDSKELLHLIHESFSRRVIPDDVQRKRNDLFEEYISSLNGNAANLYLDTIKKVMDQ